MQARVDGLQYLTYQPRINQLKPKDEDDNEDDDVNENKYKDD